MSDSSKRRGTDFETLRSMGAADGQPPRDAEDPLAELARLVSQSGPHHNQDFGDDLNTGYAPPPAPPAPPRVAPPRSAYIPPPVDPMPDRLDPLGFEDDHLAPTAHQRSYGAPMPATYNQDLDFFADEPLRGAVGGYSDLDRNFDTGAPARGYRDEFDAVEDDLLYPDAADAAGDAMPARRGRMGVFGMGALMSAALVAALGAWAYMSLGGGDGASDQPPIIAAPEKPVKVVAEAKPLDRHSKIYEDRVTSATEANVGPGPEEPIEKPRALMAETPPLPEAADPSPTMQVAQDDRPGPSGARVVRTIPISPDSMSASRPPAAEPPATIEGTGVAEGMSLERSQRFGILEPEAPAQEAAQPSASAFAEEVPMPQPRPLTALAAPQAPQQTGSTSGPQARAATDVPSPTVNGPPSSPQPQVTVTSRRPLQPQNAPPPVRPPQNSAAPSTPPPAPPAAAQPQRPVQVAAASAAPSRAQVATITSASSGAFGVQLTAQRSEQEAVAAFNTIKQRHPQVLGAYSPVVARADLGPDRGVFYRAMVPAQSQSDASNLCIQFKAAGVDCIVQRR